MKKLLIIAAGLMVGSALSASEPTAGSLKHLDEKVFLSPSLSEKSAHISVNIGSTLPSTMHIVQKDSCKVTGLGEHFKAIATKLKEQETAVFTVPASYDVVFTDGTKTAEEVKAHIHQVLSHIGTMPDAALVKAKLDTLTEVTRATFAVRAGKLVLVTDQKTLSVGEKIWRKNPEGAQCEIYHSEEEYVVGLINAGFNVDEIKRPYFGALKFHEHQKALKDGEVGLGEAYAEHNPFTIFYVSKKA